MIRIAQLKLPVGHGPEDLQDQAARALGIPKARIEEMKIRKKSLDARKKPLQYVYVVDVKASGEKKILGRRHSSQIGPAKETPYVLPRPGKERLGSRPVIVGSGPAGLFCAWMLARAGYAPLVLERGQRVRERQKIVEKFWQGAKLTPNTNVQFGEGGAGTFSDGKLNTLVKDPRGRGQKVLELFVEAGAPERILYENKPHLGTDILVEIVENIRRELEALGGQVLFGQCLAGLVTEGGRIQAVEVEPVGETDSQGQARADILGKGVWMLPADVLVLAVGHSARDTLAMLAKAGVPMEQKAFAVGVRVEHPQEMINRAQYGENYPGELPAAAYKVTRKTASGRGVYSFCMCPGGYVVDASSEEGRLAVNGMSYQARDGKNANSAMIVTVGPEDFGSTDVLAGVRFQQKLEQQAFLTGVGKIPVQLLGDFLKKQPSRCLGKVEPCIRGQWSFGDVRGIFPGELSEALAEGIAGCGQLIPGFDRPDAVLAGVESRTSSPVRILRGEQLESQMGGLFPCGEGAGYAGGITSAAMDGLRVAEKIISRYAPLL
ncbi:MAG: NAD(P)-binding protein [Lachnospiraceae bacterium]|nr:NAD(P)-binding protein [Lachnospiraceae bacterium]